jgi:hypothetical protein
LATSDIPRKLVRLNLAMMLKYWLTSELWRPTDLELIAIITKSEFIPDDDYIADIVNTVS